MKLRALIPAAALLFLVGCGSSTSASAEQSSLPQVVVVPPDEMQGEPTLQPATVTTAPSPSGTGQIESTLVEPAPSPQAPVVKKRAPKKHNYSQCNVPGKQIAITFDDGPHPTLTPKLLDILKERNVKATFYVVGRLASAYPEILQRMVAEGHEIGNHTWNHPALTRISSGRVRSEINRTTDAIVEATGIKPKTMRPPYGATNSRINKSMDLDYGMKVIMWSVDPLDWKYRNSKRVASQIIEKTQPGGIVLAHDIHKSTVAAMPAALDALSAKGFEFVTVSELLAMDQPVEVASTD